MVNTSQNPWEHHQQQKPPIQRPAPTTTSFVYLKTNQKGQKIKLNNAALETEIYSVLTGETHTLIVGLIFFWLFFFVEHNFWSITIKLLSRPMNCPLVIDLFDRKRARDKKKAGP